MAADKEQRTEQATGRRLDKEREKGNLFRNRDLVLAVLFLAEIMVLRSSLTNGYESFKNYYQRLFLYPFPAEMTLTYMQEQVTLTLILILRIIGPVVLLVIGITFIGLFVQGGWNFTFDPLHFKANRIFPKNNFTRVFSEAGVVRLFKEALLFAIVGLLAWNLMSDLWTQLPTWGRAAPQASLFRTMSISYDLAWNVGLAYLVISIVAFFMERRQFYRNLKMTKQEVKDEYKDTEGNPEIKGRIRNMQIRAARRRMMKAVPEATMVVTNPTHFAVALKYDPGKTPAPMVVAKGKNLIAQKIREIAKEHHVPIVENKPLAQTLYKQVEIGDSIPMELYRAVAEMLAYVMRMKELTYH